MTEQTPDPAAAGAKPSDVKPSDVKPGDVKPTGTATAPNPKTGSSDAARGLGGHSKDASHEPGAPAEYVEDGKPVEKA